MAFSNELSLQAKSKSQVTASILAGTSLGAAGGTGLGALEATTIDTSLIYAQLEPLLQSAVMTLIRQIPGVSNLLERSSFPKDADEFLEVAQEVLTALWEPAAAALAAAGPADEPHRRSRAHRSSLRLGTQRELRGKRRDDRDAREPGAQTGSSDADLRLAHAGPCYRDRSSCTASGYARAEPSPMGFSYLSVGTFPLGALHWPRTLTYTGQDEIESFASSALWQPLPFLQYPDLGLETQSSRD